MSRGCSHYKYRVCGDYLRVFSLGVVTADLTSFPNALGQLAPAMVKVDLLPTVVKAEQCDRR